MMIKLRAREWGAASNAIAVGYHFNTHMPDGFWVICDDRLAPRGYAYGQFPHPRHGALRSASVVGEQAGFQDTLWGFGIRAAINSGVLDRPTSLKRLLAPWARRRYRSQRRDESCNPVRFGNPVLDLLALFECIEPPPHRPAASERGRENSS